MKQKLSDYVADFLAAQGVRHVFVVTGGASIHLLHSFHNQPGIEPICVHHEQAGAMAADAYARIVGLGCAVGTSGPGATNMLTGIAGAYFDSVPVIYITGQVTTYRQKNDPELRQYGFQETDILSMVKPITKYAVQLTKALAIRYELEKCVHIAKSGRQGPVLLDLPDDLQREFVEVDNLSGYFDSPLNDPIVPPSFSGELLEQIYDMLAEAERPVLVLGAGARNTMAIDLAEEWQIPVLTTWGARDFLPSDHPLNAGTFGADGTRAGNYVIANADLVIAIGARLSTRESGGDYKTWARGAKLVIVDIDAAELRKFERFGRKPDLVIHSDAKYVINGLFALAPAEHYWPDWLEQINRWRSRYPVCPLDFYNEAAINPYVMMERLSEAALDNAQFFFDTGCTIAWAMQGLKLKSGQRIYHDFNNTAMGWAIPAALAGALARPNVQTVCVVGDGSLMFNLQELATIARHNLPIKIIVIDNGGYAMVRQTEDQWLGGVHIGTSFRSGLGFPDFRELFSAFGIRGDEVEHNNVLDSAFAGLFKRAGLRMLRICIPHNKGVIPKVPYGRPVEDGEPFLPREEFRENMIVPPLSLESVV